VVRYHQDTWMAIGVLRYWELTASYRAYPDAYRVLTELKAMPFLRCLFRVYIEMSKVILKKTSVHPCTWI